MILKIANDTIYSDARHNLIDRSIFNVDFVKFPNRKAKRVEHLKSTEKIFSLLNKSIPESCQLNRRMVLKTTYIHKLRISWPVTQYCVLYFILYSHLCHLPLRDDKLINI